MSERLSKPGGRSPIGGGGGGAPTLGTPGKETRVESATRRVGGLGGFQGNMNGAGGSPGAGESPGAGAQTPAATGLQAPAASPKGGGVSIQPVMSPSPDGSILRSSVGIGEEVRFIATLWDPKTHTGSDPDQAVWEWNGGDKVISSGSVLTWRATKLGRSEITCKVPGHGQETVSIEVIAPTAFQFENVGEKIGYAPDVAGVGMALKVTLLSTGVSFSHVQILEKGGKAGAPVGLTGYFARHPERCVHAPATAPSHFDAHNVMTTKDDASSPEMTDWPYDDGYFEWHIPNKWISGAATGDLPITVQSFQIKPDGTMTVTKQGSSQSRTPDRRLHI